MINCLTLKMNSELTLTLGQREDYILRQLSTSLMFAEKGNHVIATVVKIYKYCIVYKATRTRRS